MSPETHTLVPSCVWEPLSILSDPSEQPSALPCFLLSIPTASHLPFLNQSLTVYLPFSSFYCVSLAEGIVWLGPSVIGCAVCHSQIQTRRPWSWPRPLTLWLKSCSREQVRTPPSTNQLPKPPPPSQTSFQTTSNHIHSASCLVLLPDSSGIQSDLQRVAIHCISLQHSDLLCSTPIIHPSISLFIFFTFLMFQYPRSPQRKLMVNTEVTSVDLELFTAWAPDWPKLTADRTLLRTRISQGCK